jgi:DegV family protein with EDD domain
MMIKIVSDSSADLSPAIIQELGISIVPLYVRFGDEIYRERINISDEEFYHKLIHGKVHPVTIQPNINDFVEVYQELSKEADGIVSIHLGSKLSGTYGTALQAKETIEGRCPIEVIDSQTASLATGLICIAAAEAARAGASLQQVVATANKAVQDTHLLGLVDTLRYLLLGGRIGKAKALMGSILSVKPLLSIRDGEVAPISQVRNHAKGMEQLSDFVTKSPRVEDVSVAYSTTPDDAQALAQRIASSLNVAEVRVVRLGTTLGVHLGPGALLVALRGETASKGQTK